MYASDPTLDPILLVDDNEDDVFFFNSGAASARLANPIVVAEDGEAAVQWLEARAAIPGARMPVVVLLDLKMPRRSGFEVLSWIRAHSLSSLRHVPVVVFTSSQQDPDVERAYHLGANSYLAKPVTTAALTEMVRTVGMYWAMLNRRES